LQLSAPRASPSCLEFLRVDPPGADLAVVRRAPSRPPSAGSLLFIHGLGDASSAFAGAIEAPALARHELALVDLLGHGTSDKPANFDYRPASHAAVLFQALRAMRLPAPLHLVGYSLGGAVAVELARFPVEGLGHVVLVEPVLEESQMAFSKRIVEVSEGEFRARYAEFIGPYGAPEKSLADRRWAETAAFASSSAFYRSAKGLLEAAKRGELIAHFREALAPQALVLSPETYDRWPEAAAAESRGARVVLVESPSSAPMYDAPDAFYQAVAMATAAGP
jgi:pimeloyl-ACP methyl ester carboxylesterase